MSDFEKIYNENYQKIYFFLLSLTKNEELSEELTQQTFYKAFININSFKGNSKLLVWLCQIGKNEYFSYCKKQHKHIDNKIIEQIEDKRTNIVNYLLLNEQKIELHKLLHNLEEPYKEIFTLKIFSELSYLDISRIFNKSESWVRVTFFRAKKKIIELYEEEEK